PKSRPMPPSFSAPRRSRGSQARCRPTKSSRPELSPTATPTWWTSTQRSLPDREITCRPTHPGIARIFAFPLDDGRARRVATVTLSLLLLPVDGVDNVDELATLLDTVQV